MRGNNGYKSGMSAHAEILSTIPQLRPLLAIGSQWLASRVLLAPMSGVTDVAMRRIARRFGAGMVVSEMVASDDFAQGGAEAMLRADGAGIDQHVVQLAGCDPHWMNEAARLAQGAGAHVIDINMGCPAKRVTGGAAGSALMRDLDHAQRLIEATVAAVSIPVTLKMRLGWDHAAINAPELARRAENAGIAMVTVHGRTRQQFYKGHADWAAIAAVKRAVTIPVVANGDCASLADARAMLAASGADAVMIGRAALGRPWLAGALGAALACGAALVQPPRAAQKAAALEHFEALLGLFGREQGLRHARKHLSAYASHAGANEALRLALVTCENAAAAMALLALAFAGDDQEIAA